VADDATAPIFPARRAPSKDLCVVSSLPEADARRLLAGFLSRVFRRPAQPEAVEEHVGFAIRKLRNGKPFDEALRSAYKLALCSLEFLFFDEKPGPLDDRALARGARGVSSRPDSGHAPGSPGQPAAGRFLQTMAEPFRLWCFPRPAAGRRCHFRRAERSEIFSIFFGKPGRSRSIVSGCAFPTRAITMIFCVSSWRRRIPSECM
jgi:hypothetical protein